MKFSYNWLQSFFKKRLPLPEKLAEILTMHSFEVKKVVKLNDDFVLDIGILPNRMPDCASHIGVAREIAVILGSKLRIPGLKFKEDKKRKISDILKIEVKDENLCSRYYAKVITDIKVKSSPKWIQRRLVACGIEPINNIVDATNYVMLETGQPLHAFDFNKISGSKIIVRKARKREKIPTLDNKIYHLEKDDLIIADSREPIAIAGVKGGKKAEIIASTKGVVLEAANFNRLNVYRTSKRLKLQTDASLRFSSGLDPNLAEEGINRVCFLIQKVAEGRILKDKIDFYPRKVLPKKIRLNLNYTQSLLGVKISKREIIRISKNLGFKVTYQLTNLPSYQLVIEVPTFRQDIFIPEDLIEEIGRVYGYQKIQAKIPVLPVLVSKKDEGILWEGKIKETFKGLGFIEVFNYSFISERDRQLFKKVNKTLQLIEIKNPTSSNTRYLRPSLIPNLLKIIDYNQARFKKINIFETGKVFYWQGLKGKEQKIQEKRMLSGLVSGKDKFFELKGKIEAFFENLGLADIYFDSYQATPEKTPSILWQKDNAAEIKVNDQEIGFLGQISDEIFDFYQIRVPVFAFEIDFNKLLEFVVEEHEYEILSPYPEMIRDIAVLVPAETLVGEVIQKIHFGGGRLVRDVEIFDIFEGDPLPKGKKNLAFHIIYQAKDRTLTSKEVDKTQRKIISLLEENPSWEVRR